jgi:ribosomal protein S18 acetylase RimI-like enzyme
LSLSVREARLQDVERAAPLFDAYRNFYGQAPDLPRARDWLQQRLAGGEATLLLAESESELLGFALLYPMWSSVSTAPILVLNDLFVAPQARRRGAARALLAAAAAHGRARGALRLVLETAADNHGAQALYRATGWTADATQWFHLALVER